MRIIALFLFAVLVSSMAPQGGTLGEEQRKTLHLFAARFENSLKENGFEYLRSMMPQKEPWIAGIKAADMPEETKATMLAKMESSWDEGMTKVYADLDKVIAEANNRLKGYEGGLPSLQDYSYSFRELSRKGGGINSVTFQAKFNVGDENFVLDFHALTFMQGNWYLEDDNITFRTAAEHEAIKAAQRKTN